MTRLLVILFGSSLFAASPVISELQPRGAERNRPFTLTINGRDLPSDARIQSTLPATFTPTTNNMKSLTFLVEPRAEATPGIYPIRLESPTKGISNILLLTIGMYPEQTEEESQPYSKPNRNDSIETAEPITANPVTINGTLKGPERDVFRIFAKAGERRVFEVEARRCGSAIDPTLRLLDASGKQLALSDDTSTAGLDARLDFTFQKDGNYYIEVHDARFSRQVQNFYRLKIGPYAYADTIFPLGGKRGEVTEVTFSGQALKVPVKTAVDLRNVAPHKGLTVVNMPDSPALPILFAISDLPEFTAPIDGAIAIPSVINARLSKPGAIDRYMVKVSPGDKLLIELEARNLGTSKLEGIISIYDSNKKKLDSAGDKPLPDDVFAVQGTSRTSNDPFLNFTVPADVHEVTIAVEDLAERGGANYGYRLITRREAEEFQLGISTPYLNIPAGGTAMINVSADRRGYDGPITLSIADLPKGVHVDGGNIAREYLDVNNSRTINRRGIITITADTDATLPAQLTVIGEGKLADGTVIRKRARGTALAVDVAGASAQGVVDRQRAVNAPWIAQDLPAAIAEPAQATLEVKQTKLIPMAEGGRYEFEYSWKTRPGATAPKDVSVEIVGIKDIRVIDMKGSPTGGTFAVTTTRATDPARYDMYISGRVRTDEGVEAIISRAIILEVTEGTTKQ